MRQQSEPGALATTITILAWVCLAAGAYAGWSYARAGAVSAAVLPFATGLGGAVALWVARRALVTLGEIRDALAAHNAREDRRDERASRPT